MSKKDEREEYDMCLALREWEAEARAEGRADALALMVSIVGSLRENLGLSDEELAVHYECTVAEVRAIRETFEI